MTRILSAVKRYLKHTDLVLLLLVLGVSCTSVLLLYGMLQNGLDLRLEIGRRQVLVQSGAIALGLGAAILLSLIDYHKLLSLWKLHVPLAYLLILLTFVIGVGAAARPEDQRWLVVPVVGVWVQPAELFKISFILALAYHIIKLGDAFNSPVGLISVALHCAIPIVLVHVQGDTGSALLIATIGLSMLFAAGLRWSVLAAGTLVAVAAVPAMWLFILKPFQKERILVLLHQAEADPLGDYYQQFQAKVAMAAGGASGTGIAGADPVYVPKAYTDFIFTRAGEAFGFFGACLLLAVMLMIGLRLLSVAAHAPDRGGRLICVGVFAMLIFQVFVNVGMCLSILPVIGNTFPFLSYGGSSILTSFLGIGLALSVHMRRERALFFG